MEEIKEVLEECIDVNFDTEEYYEKIRQIIMENVNELKNKYVNMAATKDGQIIATNFANDFINLL